VRFQGAAAASLLSQSEDVKKRKLLPEAFFYSATIIRRRKKRDTHRKALRDLDFASISDRVVNFLRRGNYSWNRIIIAFFWPCKTLFPLGLDIQNGLVFNHTSLLLYISLDIYVYYIFNGF
jgi:hypothetical protein